MKNLNFIGRIYYFDEIINHEKVNYIEYIKNPTEIINDNIPSLIIGWINLKKLNLSTNILNKTIIDDILFWEYSFEENKEDHVNGVESFVFSAPNIFFKKNYNFKIIDPVFDNIYNNQIFVQKYKIDYEKIYIFKNKIIYLLYQNNIFSINIEMFKFFKLDIREIINNNMNILYDKNGDYFSELCKKYNFFYDNKRYVVITV